MGFEEAFELTTDAVIDSKGYLIVWADKETDQGPLHASFKLSGDGEEIWLYDADGGLVQTLTFGSIDTDTTYGRLSDGRYDNLPTPTPNAPNE